MFEGARTQIALADLSGKIWLAEKRINNGPKESLDISALPPGAYLTYIGASGKLHRVLSQERVARLNFRCITRS